MKTKDYDLLILGGGPAGLTAAIYTSRAYIKTLVIAGNPPGGQLMNTTDVENFPGFPEGIMGPDLIMNFRKQAERFGTEFVDENVVGLKGSADKGFLVKTDASNDYKGKCVIVATGASVKWLGLESEQRLRGKGVSACATCDGFFFKDKITAVVGGGDASMEEAIFLTKFSPKVYLIARNFEGNLKASKIMLKRAQDNPKIEFLYNTEVKEVLGEENVEGLKVFNNQTKKEWVMDDVKGLFIAIGHKPNTGFLEGVVELGKFNYINVIDNTKTTKEGIFVAGDVADYTYRQAVTAAGHGCMAALDAEKFLSKKGVQIRSVAY
jgi:thioredoxin reductase (NADPH)